MTTEIRLAPKAGFCIKTTTLQAGSIPALSSPLAVPKGLKVFVNIAWDANCPAPPDADEEVIQAALRGDSEEGVTAGERGGWYLPVVVSDGRQDRDKAQNPSLVFDAVFNASLKSRTLRDPMFKLFLIELALERIEAQSTLVLSREIATPKLASKGPLTPRVVRVPILGSPPPAKSDPGAPAEKKKALIEELPDTGRRATSDEVHLNTQGSASKSSANVGRSGQGQLELAPPPWTWSVANSAVKIVLQVPKLVRTDIPKATLDMEPHRILLSAPPHYALDINLTLPDSELDLNALALKRNRKFDMDGARAEWHVDRGVLIIFA